MIFQPNITDIIVAVTGHRPDKLGSDYDLVSPLVKKIRTRLCESINKLNPDYMISGMALGIDTLWALLALECGIPLIAAIPFENQPCKWPLKSYNLYQNILSRAFIVVNTSGKLEYKLSYMQQRNEWMVDHCTHLIAVHDGSLGGTNNCLKYARDKMDHSKIDIINPQFISV